MKEEQIVQEITDMVEQLDEETSKTIYNELHLILEEIEDSTKISHLEKLKQELIALQLEQSRLIPGLPEDLASALPPELKSELCLQLKEAYLNMYHDSFQSSKEKQDITEEYSEITEEDNDPEIQQEMVVCSILQEVHGETEKQERTETGIEIPEELIDLQLQQEILLSSIPHELMEKLHPDLANNLRAAVMESVKTIVKEDIVIDKERTAITIAESTEIVSPLQAQSLHKEDQTKEDFETLVNIQIQQNELMENIPADLLRNLPVELQDAFRKGLLENVQNIEQVAINQLLPGQEQIEEQNEGPEELCSIEQEKPNLSHETKTEAIEEKDTRQEPLKKSLKMEGSKVVHQHLQTEASRTDTYESEKEIKNIFLTEVPDISSLKVSAVQENIVSSGEGVSDDSVEIKPHIVESQDFSPSPDSVEQTSNYSKQIVDNIGIIVQDVLSLPEDKITLVSGEEEANNIKDETNSTENSDFSEKPSKEIYQEQKLSLIPEVCSVPEEAYTKDDEMFLREDMVAQVVITSNKEGITNVAVPDINTTFKVDDIEEITLIEESNSENESVGKMKFLTDFLKRKVNKVSNDESPVTESLFTITEVSSFESMEETKTKVKDHFQNVREYINQRKIVVVQKTIITIVETVSRWLDNVEYKILKVKKIKSIQKKKQELKNIRDEIEVIEETVDELVEVTEMAVEIFNDEARVTVSSCVDCLREQVQTVKLFHQKSENELEESEEHWEEFLAGVEMAEHLINDLRTAVHNQNVKDEVSENSVETLEDLETCNKGHRNKLVYLMRTGVGLTNILPENVIPETLHELYHDSKTIEQTIIKDKEKKISLMVSQHEYEQTLKEFQDIFLIADNFFASELSALDLHHFNEEIARQKRFFLNLSHCMQILNSMQENLGSALKDHYLAEHEEIKSNGGKLLEQAAEHICQLEGAASQWAQIINRKMEIQCEVEQLMVQVGAEHFSAENYRVQSKEWFDLQRRIISVKSQISQLDATLENLTSVVKSPELANMLKDLKQEQQSLEFSCRLKVNKLKQFSNIWQHYVRTQETLQSWLTVSEQLLLTDRKQYNLLVAELLTHEKLLKDANRFFSEAIDNFDLADEDLQKQLHGQLEAQFYDLKKKLDSHPVLDEPLEDLSLIISEVQSLLKTTRDVMSNQQEENEPLSSDQLLKNLSMLENLSSCLSQQMTLIQNNLSQEKEEDTDNVQTLGALVTDMESLQRELQHKMDSQADLLDRKMAYQASLSALSPEIQELEQGVAQCSGTVCRSFDQLKALSFLTKVGEKSCFMLFLFCHISFF